MEASANQELCWRSADESGGQAGQLITAPRPPFPSATAASALLLLLTLLPHD